MKCTLSCPCVCVLVAQSCPTLCDLMDYRPPGSSVHGISQARILEWDAISFSRESSRPRDQTQVSCIVGGRFTLWATRKAQIRHIGSLNGNLPGILFFLWTSNNTKRLLILCIFLCSFFFFCGNFDNHLGTLKEVTLKGHSSILRIAEEKRERP